MNFAALATRTVVVVALASAALVIGLYLLRRTPRVQQVSSVHFWRKALERSKPRSLFATRIPWLAMLLSLLVAAMLVFELGEPRIGAGFSGTTVLVLDADRTMGARDERGRRRIDEAIALVRAAVHSDTVTGQVAIVRAGVHPELLVPLTHRAADAERALARVELDDGTADLGAAVALARTLVRSARTAGRVLVVADRGDFSAANEPAIPVAHLPVGRPGETLAVTALDARRDPNALGEYHVTCTVRSYATRPGRARLVLRDRDTVLSTVPVTLVPGGTFEHRARGFSSEQAELVARLEDIDLLGGRDALDRDDVAYATVPAVVATRVLLVTRGNRFLQNALAANPSVSFETIDPGELAARRNDLGRYHVLLLDRVAPEPPIVHPAQLYFGAMSARVMGLGPERAAPRVTAFLAEHRVLAGLRVDQVQLTRAQVLEPGPEDRVLVRSGRDALVVARDREGMRLLALGFDTESTDLVQRIAFPLFVHNALVWLDRRDREYRSWQAPGEPLRAAGNPALVLMPDGSGRSVRDALHDTGRAGLYHTADRAVAVSAASEAGSLATSDAPSNAPAPAPRGRPALALILAGALLVFVLLEWVLLHRGRLT